MSDSLVRRGLDLFKDDISSSSQPQPSSTKNLTEKELTKLFGTNKKGFKRKLKRLQTKQTEATLKGKKVKSQDHYESHVHHDKTDANINALNFMKLLNKDESQVMKQAAERHEAKNPSRRQKKTQKDAVTKTQEESVFTEEDFAKFFKEYNFT